MNTIRKVARAIGVGRRHRRGFNGSRFRMNPSSQPSLNGGVQKTGMETLVGKVGSTNVINKGRRSLFNEEAALHANAIMLQIQNTGVNRADLVLSAGRFGAEYPQLIADGANAFNNDDGDPSTVTVTAEYGVDGSVNSWANFLNWVEHEGFFISATKLEWTLAAQKIHKLRFTHLDFSGDNRPDYLSPNTYDDPTQFHRNVVFSDVGYILDSKTIVKYSVEPAETVIFTLWYGAMYDKEQVLRDYSRRHQAKTLG